MAWKISCGRYSCLRSFSMCGEEQSVLRGLSRRHFMRASAAASLAALGGGEPRMLMAADEKIKPTADTLILLWMAGGMAQTETFDPKKYTPYETGLESKRVLSTFRSMDTVVDNIKISEGFDRIAKVMDCMTLVRTYQAGDLGFILH